MKSKLPIFLLLIFYASTSLSDNGSTSQYVKISEGMVVNYGDPSLNRLKYLKVNMDVRVPTIEAVEIVYYHLPALKDAMVSLFSRQDDAMIRSAQGKEELRLLALKAVQDVIKKEEEEAYITDLLFSGFVVQR